MIINLVIFMVYTYVYNMVDGICLFQEWFNKLNESFDFGRLGQTPVTAILHRKTDEQLVFKELERLKRKSVSVSEWVNFSFYISEIKHVHDIIFFV